MTPTHHACDVSGVQLAGTCPFAVAPDMLADAAVDAWGGQA